MLIRKRVVQGDQATIVGTALRSNGDVDDLTDANVVTFIMTRVGDDDPTVDDAATLVNPLTSGRMQYTFATGETDIPGDYNLSFHAVWDDHSTTYPLDGVLRIDPDLTTTVDEELTLTFASVEDFRSFFPTEDISAISLFEAETVISGIYNRSTMGYGSISAQDKHWLALGTCIQARWMPSQPGYFTQSNVSNISTPGMNASLGKDALLLSPVARSVLQNLSWVGPRSVSSVPDNYAGYSGLRDIPENSSRWRPLKTGTYWGGR
jgi:hypothetical protein